MQNLTQIRTRLGSVKVTSPAVTIDLSLADTGDIEADSTYVGRVVSARFINPNSEDRSPKIDVCIEILGTDGNRIGVINDYLFLSARALRRLKEFLLSASIVTEETAKTFRPDVATLCRALPGQMVGFVTREGVALDGSPTIVIASYVSAEVAVEQYAAEQGEGQE